MLQNSTGSSRNIHHPSGGPLKTPTPTSSKAVNSLSHAKPPAPSHQHISMAHKPLANTSSGGVVQPHPSPAYAVAAGGNQNTHVGGGAQAPPVPTPIDSQAPSVSCYVRLWAMASHLPLPPSLLQLLGSQPDSAINPVLPITPSPLPPPAVQAAQPAQQMRPLETSGSFSHSQQHSRSSSSSSSLSPSLTPSSQDTHPPPLVQTNSSATSAASSVGSGGNPVNNSMPAENSSTASSLQSGT